MATQIARPALQAVWNKDLSITLFCRGKKVMKFKGSMARESVDAFCSGWFDTKEKSQWKLRWTYK